MGKDFAAPLSPPQIRDALQKDGFVILPQFIHEAQIKSLLEASRSLVSKARAGEWPHLRTLPKQFPPWQSTPENGIWGVQHLLHPDLPLTPEESNAFKELYFGDAVTNVVKAVLGEECNDNMLVMELFNMLVTPERDFALRWHRDDVSFDLSVEQEAAALGLQSTNGSTTNGNSHQKHEPQQQKRKAYHTQYNIPLLPDCSLHLIPGSHLRPRTADEVEKLAKDPFTDSLDGWVAVELEPGDVAFYDNDLIHRGSYKADTERLTLHGSVGDVRAGSKRARNVLQHGCAWAGRCDFGSLTDGVRERAERMRSRLVELGSVGGDVGFAHQD